MTTEIGTIKIELLPNQAPITVENFLRYIDEDRYSDFTFYRVVNMKNQNSDSVKICLLYTSPSPRDVEESRMPSSA